MTREMFDQELAELGALLNEEARLCQRSLDGALEALIAPGSDAADKVIAGDDGVDRVYLQVEHAVESLRWLIVNGDLAPGARVNQEEVAARVGLSVAPVREALRVLELHREPLGFELRVVDITGDAELERRHREQIPVVEIDGRKAFKYRVDPAELRRRVLQASQSGQ